MARRNRRDFPGLHRRVGRAVQHCSDFALLFSHYAQDDLRSAGMAEPSLQRFFAPDVELAEKWRPLKPTWHSCRAAGYMHAVTRTVELLFGQHTWDGAACERISQRMRQHARPGFYRTVLDAAGVESCQVNSLEAALFCASSTPELCGRTSA